MQNPIKPIIDLIMPTKAVYETTDEGVYTTSGGHPYPEPYEVQREFTAKGSGALGYLEITHDISDICSAAIFNKVGKQSERGSPDTARDPRGFSIKIKTEEGIWDWVFNNTPVFFLRDAVKFPHFIHTQKRDPQSHLAHGDDPDMFWDYLSQNAESIHQVMILFGDRGVPDGYRGMNGYSGHTFKFVNKDGTFKYVQIHCLADQLRGAFLTQEDSVKKAGESPDYSTRDLFEAIEKGEHPSWTCYIQEMTPEQAESFRFIWPHKDFPLRPFAKLVLNENPINYHAQIEQSAFSPAHMPPGVEPSADPVLQSRLFSYNDAHLYRLGTNYTQLPVNKPINPVANFQRDGPMALDDNQGNRPNYKSTIKPLNYPKRPYNMEHEVFIGHAMADLSEVTELDFEPARALWSKVFDDGAKERFVKNVSGHLGNVSVERIKSDQVAIFLTVDEDLGKRVAKEIGLKQIPQPYKPLPASSAYRFAPNIKGSGKQTFGNQANGLH
ncbi:catalase-like domain-containing protein [Melampsora americana]|nr:catalase-like domain-containing protein [Melampsora americana]